MRGRLPLSSAHHPPTRACPGCRLDGIEAVSLEEDAAGLRAQGILQAKLGLRDPDGDIAEALKEGLLALPRHRFWKALSALLYLGAHLASISPEMLHDPLKRAPEIRGIHRPGVYPVVPDRYAMHCLVATVIGWMEHPESLGESVRAVVMPRYHYLGRLDLPDVLSLHFDSSPEATEAVREALKAISSGWISLEEIAEGRPDEGLTAARLEAEARRVGINPGSLEGIGANKKELYVSPEDAERLSRIVLLCMAPDCSGEVVGYKGDYRFCEKHEFRCRDRNCEKAAGRDGTCSAHRQNGASAVPSAAVSVFVETLSESDSAARVLSKKCAYPGGCLRASSTDYGYYCRIHAQELDVPRRRYLCQHLECSRPSHKSCRPFCWTHAPEHGIPTPERCRRTPCRGYAKPGTGGLCARCFADPTRAVTRSKQSGRSRCAIVVCTFPRASRYGKYCVVHGTESGTDKPSAWCEEEDCRRYRLGKAGYCYRHAREKRIWISGVMCAETTEECFCRATSYGGFCRKHGGDPWKPRRKAARR